MLPFWLLYIATLAVIYWTISNTIAVLLTLYVKLLTRSPQ